MLAAAGIFRRCIRSTWRLLGADYETDSASGMYRFKKIFAGENWDANARSPLTEPGVNVKEGELVAINGRALRSPETPDEMLVNTANEVVTLTVNSKPSARKERARWW